MSLTTLIIGGIKSIRDETRIPIAPLTFLFGPNSAGKSSVIDAIELLRLRLAEGPKTRSAFRLGLGAMADPARSVHVMGDVGADGSDATYAPITLGVHFDEFPGTAGTVSDEHDNYDYTSIQQAVLRIFWDRLVDQSIEIVYRGSAYGVPFATEVKVQEKPLFSILDQGVVEHLLGDRFADFDASLGGIVESGAGRTRPRLGGGLMVNAQHPLIAETFIGDRLRRLLNYSESADSGLARSAVISVASDEPMILIRTEALPFRAKGWGTTPAGSGLLSEFVKQTAARDRLAQVLGVPLVEDFIECIDEICSSLTFLLLQLCYNATDKLNVCRVSGDRGIPGQSDLTFDEESPVQVDSGNRSIQEYARWLGERESGESFQSMGAISSAVNEMSDLVSDSLSQVLLGARRYRTATEVTRITREVLTARSDDQIGENTRYTSQLYLRDQNDRALDFKDVGSGVGYVLPVLTALWANERSWIEQPELHLHPAAQCELGDVFIRALNRGSLSIVETHSEHLLLRVLKRIRQTAQGKLDIPELKCAPEAVSVLYFDPKADGSTDIRHLQVTRFGDFSDRWPAGFFEERDAELFDE